MPNIIDEAFIEILPELSRFAGMTKAQIATAMGSVGATVEKSAKQATTAVKRETTAAAATAKKATQSAEREVSNASKRIHGGLSKTFGSIKPLVAPALAAFTTLGAIRFAQGTVATFQNVAIEVLRLQRVAGGTAEEMSRLRFAAVQSGISVPTLTKGIQLLSKNLVSSQGNAKKTADLTKLLGFNFQDAHGKVKSMSNVLPEVAERFKTMPNGPQKTALALKLFGRAGTEMLPFLNKGAAGIKELEARSDKFGTTLSGKSLASLVAYKKQQREFGATMLGVKLAIGGALLVAMTRVGKLVNEFIQQMRDGTGAGGMFAKIMHQVSDVQDRKSVV